MEFTKEGLSYFYRDEEGNRLAEVTFEASDDPKVQLCTATFTDPSLRGQGIAGKMLDHAVEDLSQEGIKIKAVCPYVVNKFENQPEKYDAINADKA